ncbi:uncharacterized protein STEHIDRAFT_51065 [Stereum hirsutum FP-91666 SS1]|uniref:uncharacterized protein n=1 Tax=Stereum hirsutum (strain FP-91666) TaxID=721885 RepID=UPI000440BD7B|nr:uncharacterized protein STEHIDRAFT_51065 [Stereum hirsutum FP-91666 SS1]EIM90394.1 hypothetical protein STEHIDRAFT_51065 [Stereum hirsutum FP-91666 SS1]
MAAPVKRGTGRGTFFSVGLGACGWNSVDADYVVALPTSDYGDGSNCGKHITIEANGVQSDAVVVDECPSCAEGALDMSTGLFQTFGSLSVGVVTVNWWYKD